MYKKQKSHAKEWDKGVKNKDFPYFSSLSTIHAQLTKLLLYCTNPRTIVLHKSDFHVPPSLFSLLHQFFRFLGMDSTEFMVVSRYDFDHLFYHFFRIELIFLSLFLLFHILCSCIILFSIVPFPFFLSCPVVKTGIVGTPKCSY